MKKKQQPDCPYCHGIHQTPLHLFVECLIAKSFWNKYTRWYNATCGGNIASEQNKNNNLFTPKLTYMQIDYSNR